MRALAPAGFVLACLLALVGGPAAAQGAEAPVLKLQIVGGLAAPNQFTRHEAPFWTQKLSRLSNGKFDATIVASDHAGLPGADMLRLMQLGVVPFGTAILASVATQHPMVSAADLAGLNPDMTSLKKNLAAFRPTLQNELRERYGIETLAIYVYPAQVFFCTQPFSKLEDLAGRRVRVSSPTQADFVKALRGTPVRTGFSEIVQHITSNKTDCAITGTMSGNTLGLHEVTRYVHAMPISWGLAVFGANRQAWQALPLELRTLLTTELPLLEAAIWAESERETTEGLACNVGASTCQQGRVGQMTLVAADPDDERRRRTMLTDTVLPRWLARCGPGCTDIWNQTLGRSTGIMAQTPPVAMSPAAP